MTLLDNNLGEALGLDPDKLLPTLGAGAAANFPDVSYAEAGATVVEPDQVWESDVVTTVSTPAEDRLATLRPGSTLVSMLAPATHPELLSELAERQVNALALDAVPRISRAQALDVLSTLSNVAGYRAVIEAAEEYGGMFTGQVTAAGKTSPANVFVIGAGVAGLAAIGAAGSLGAQVRAFDVRPEVGEQIESMGASFVFLEFEARGVQRRVIEIYGTFPIVARDKIQNRKRALCQVISGYLE